MTFKEYQEQALKSDNRTINPGADWYYALKLNGEAGEVAELVGKANRNGQWAKPIEGARRDDLGYELGDVLWYIAALARHYGFTLEEIALMNVNKLAARHAVVQK